ncbi:MAG TPA: GreA/GreB family elongation factor [Thermoanaerobaculia bacterium]|nr:GreA/GreB family elongation factor [Thermoanaerobaculia bacterium]
MLTGFPNLTPEVQHLVDQKKFDALGQLWTRKMEENAEDFPFFFDLAAAAKKKGGSTQAVGWLRALADFHNVGGNESLIRVLLELARMSPTDASVRKDLTTALRVRYAGHPALSAVIAQFPLEKAADPSEVAGRIARWLRFQPNAIYFMPGRGAGRLVDMNPALDVMRLEVAGNRMPLSLVSAEKNLVPLPEGHFLRRKVEDPKGLTAFAESEPSEALRLLLTSFGRSLTVQEVKDHFAGLVPEERWTPFWTAARKNRQVLVAGSAKSAKVTWSDSADAAEGSVREAFLKATPAARVDLARKHAKRSKELALFFAQALAGDAQKVAPGQPALAWELSQAAARLAPDQPEAFPAETLLASADLRRVLGEIRDQGAREKALQAVRQSRPDWAEIFIEQIGREDDARVLTTLFDALGDRAADLSRKILRSPRSAPRAFVWLCERMHADGKTDAPGLFFALTDALRMDEFSGLRARMKEFFEPGGFGVALVRSASSEEEAREMLHALDRVPGLEEHRRATVREALLMKFPELRAPAREYLYATAESIEARRQEVIHMKSVELPANAIAMKTAKEHGDLRENFEYHAARQKHEYLSARIATIADELERSRALDPTKIDVSEIRVGARVRLKDVATGAERDATILGPWDSKPEEGIYSYQSEFAERLLGSRVGDRVNLSEGQVEVVAIAPWK